MSTMHYVNVDPFAALVEKEIRRHSMFFDTLQSAEFLHEPHILCRHLTLIQEPSFGMPMPKSSR